MITKFEEIVDINSICKPDNPIRLNELLIKANSENLKSASSMSEKNLLIIIDMQNDFMETGSLPVTGSAKDSENISRFIYANMDSIYRIACSLDTHNPFQIFHACWWIDQDGKNPPPYTAITMADLDSGKWRPAIDPIKSRNYVQGLEKANKTLLIWPYHCIQGTYGCALENQLSNMIYFHSVAKKSVVQRIVKGSDPLTEMYGIIKPEFDEKNYINIEFLNQMEAYDRVFIAGEAGDFCVKETVRQITSHFSSDAKMLKKIHVLEDCMSPVMAPSIAEAFKDVPEAGKINFIKSDFVI